LDLKHIFVGSEGILGIITRAVLQVHPVSRGIQTALLALPNLENIPELLTLLRHELSGLSSLEVITRGSIDLYKEIEPNTREPFDQIYPACLIVEEETGHGEKDEEYFLESLSKILDTGLIADVLVAQGDSQAKKIWSLRDGITEAISRSGLSHKFDVTVPPGELPKFLNKMHSIGNDTDGVRPVLFGHLGDGNIHVNMLKDSDLSNEEFIAKGVELAESIYTFVAELRGSISAEHGIGILKRPYLHFSRTPEEINMMRAMKTLWDPNNILNPGVLFEVK
jgi:FAD/FMN-containing dehydrogenase